ncbi:hypothetical protein RhiirC2_758849 [Rhizophagus irregularis]|uniref:Uncharacterized protein n=1 Tax=Rhizophagus irregularis TaxID=588596 RepID=A0A2N1MN21_9GLOM|nr:hypothetical protein RhiirC2_758849 [Rhizophagus irregularis]
MELLISYSNLYPLILSGINRYTFMENSDTFTDYSFPAESLELGDYLLSGVFVSEAKSTQSVKFSINHRKQKIIVEFDLVVQLL